MDKHFITADELLIDSFKLAEQLYVRGCRPHFIIGVWRGGTPTGIAVQEFLDYMGVETDHIAIRTSSYYGIDQQHKDIQVHGLDYVVDNIEADQELLIVDDVFDSGRSIRAIIETLQKRCRRNMPTTLKIACPWYKPKRNITAIKPDFYIHATDQWLVFPHELKGLSVDEIAEGKGEHIAETIRRAQMFKASADN